MDGMERECLAESCLKEPRKGALSLSVACLCLFLGRSEQWLRPLRWLAASSRGTPPSERGAVQETHCFVSVARRLCGTRRQSLLWGGDWLIQLAGEWHWDHSADVSSFECDGKHKLIKLNSDYSSAKPIFFQFILFPSRNAHLRQAVSSVFYLTFEKNNVY